VESDDILDSVIKSQTRLFVILGVIMIAGSLILSKWLFIPIERTLDKIKRFNLKDLQPIRLEKTGTREFSILNRFITQMTEKIRQDYLALKEFSENASHELQTPVAIIKGKLELLSQSENLTREQMDYLASAQDAASHMGQLHQSLTMLMKIENREFSNLKELNLSEELDHLIRDFRELIELRNLRIDYAIDPNIAVKNDQLLIRILLSNLLQNAIRHNQENGEIGIYLRKSELIIKNTGENPGIPTTELFKRFKKAKQSARSSGLGLAIVSEICEISGYKLDYRYLDGWHQVTINLNES
jgi:signal transduction histidine kinase